MTALLPRGEVHIWITRLIVAPRLYSELYSVLSDSERERAGEFCYDEHRTLSVVSRGLLRSLLAAYTGTAAHELNFSYGPNGKPFISTFSLHFNVSHSSRLGMFALAHEALLGIDVEQVRPMESFEQVARQNFATEEMSEWIALPEDQRVEAFYNCWTRKEAYVKAVGTGLSVPLQSFRVSLVPRDRPRILSINGNSDRAAEWTMFSLIPDKKSVGAVAIYGRDWRMCVRNCSDAAAFLEATRGRCSGELISDRQG